MTKLRFVFLLLWNVFFCLTATAKPFSENFKDGFFHNPWGININKGLWDVLMWQVKRESKVWPEKVEGPTYKRTCEPSESSICVTFIGHATFLIETRWGNIVTDPQFSERASLVSFAGPKRVRPAVPALHQLPNIQLAVVSHNHYDHMDLASLEGLSKSHDLQILVPKGNKALLDSEGISNGKDMDWWQMQVLGEIKIWFVPVQHWSRRGIWDRNKTLWGGYVLQVAGKNLFFGGDTGYGPHFKVIQEELGPMDLSFIPIGAYEPRWFMKNAHLNPEEAVQAHRDLKSRQSIGMHFGTFQLTDEGIHDPVLDLEKSLEKNGILPSSFDVLEFGVARRIWL